MRRIHIVGRKNSGKTTLVVDLVRQLSEFGYRVGTIKHTHHRHELDVPGKDSHRHREAGAAAVGILSPGMSAVFWAPPRVEALKASHDRYAAFEPLFAQCDLVIVEGDTRTDSLKIEAWREELSSPPLAFEDKSIHAIVTDSLVPGDAEVWPRHDVATLARRILHLARPEAS
jgi:molybdopterin-guanine dinucleotide biosynthesis protein MobB